MSVAQGGGIYDPIFDKVAAPWLLTAPRRGGPGHHRDDAHRLPRRRLHGRGVPVLPGQPQREPHARSRCTRNLLSGDVGVQLEELRRTTAETVKVIWTAAARRAVGQSACRGVGLLQDDLPEDFRIYSDWVEQHGDPDDDCEPSSPPCKRTKAGGGLERRRPVGRRRRTASRSSAEGDYFGWLAYNAPNAVARRHRPARRAAGRAGDASRRSTRSRECIDDVAGCALACVPVRRLPLGRLTGRRPFGRPLQPVL